VLFAPMAADDVATAVGRVAVGAPVNGIVEVGGPEKVRMDELVRQTLKARNDPRTVVTDPEALYFGAYPVDDSTLMPADGAGRARSTTRTGSPSNSRPRSRRASRSPTSPKEAPMSPRLLYLLSAQHAPRCERDRADAWTAVARMPGRRQPRWAQRRLAVIA
jgi:hypothetical protein